MIQKQRMPLPEIEISGRPSAEDTALLFRNLAGFNEVQAGPASACELAIFARHQGEIVAGLTGFTHWNWLSIKYLWVTEQLRRQGLGARLVLAAEREARRRGCEHVHLDTFSFQAVPFYERLGYSVFGRLEDYPAGHAKIFLQKRSLAE
ncbi:MAG: GNAT family N-acetyltransferase [Verrucomicrobia bacterium]|nr:GNAT family N-acetyltransferase [Verrucomicrobiota bacterium]